ncbi:TPA: hypothetical protein ACH3X1_001702 [Trebouxia sp. C0004]
MKDCDQKGSAAAAIVPCAGAVAKVLAAINAALATAAAAFLVVQASVKAASRAALECFGMASFQPGRFIISKRRLQNSVWLCAVQEEESCIEQGPRRAHAGIMAAATAIWKDLRVHRILPALLNVSSDSDDEDNPEYDIGAGEHDGFDEAYGPDDDPAPMPEDQRLPAPHEHPGAHHKKEPIAPADDGTHGHSPSRRHVDDHADDAETHEARRQGEHTERQASMNPITLVGKGLHAGVTSLQEVPQQAIGHMMGGVSGGHRSQRRLAAQDPTEAAGSSPRRAAGHSPHRQASAKSPHKRQTRQAAAAKRNQHAAAAAADDAPAVRSTERSMGSDHPESDHPGSDNSADVHPQGQPSDPSGLRGWDKVRKVVRGTPIIKSRGDENERSVPALASASPTPEGNPATRELKRDSSSGGSLSRNTTGPMQYMWSRGGKMAAVFAMMGSRGNKRYESKEGDIQERHASHGNGPCDITSQGAANAPGDDAASQAGARDPQKSSGAQESSGSGEEEGAEQSKDSAMRNDYAADIIKRGLNKEGWKLVITGKTGFSISHPLPPIWSLILSRGFAHLVAVTVSRLIVFTAMTRVSESKCRALNLFKVSSKLQHELKTLYDAQATVWFSGAAASAAFPESLRVRSAQACCPPPGH